MDKVGFSSLWTWIRGGGAFGEVSSFFSSVSVSFSFSVSACVGGETVGGESSEEAGEGVFSEDVSSFVVVE